MMGSVDKAAIKNATKVYSENICMEPAEFVGSLIIFVTNFVKISTQLKKYRGGQLYSDVRGENDQLSLT